MSDESTGEASPLAEPQINSLDELFSRDPFGYSQQDISLIVAELRRQRRNWQQAEAQGKRSAPKAKPSPKAKGPELTLEDLL